MVKKITFIFTLLFMILLVAFPQESINGAKDGLVLWYDNLVPSLLPYMILTNMLLSTGIIQQINSSKRFLSVHSLLSIFIGIMCGNPMGAFYVANNYKKGNLYKSAAQWLLPIVNLCSPAFIIQFIIIQKLNNKYFYEILLGIYGSTIITAIITYPFYRLKYNKEIENNILPSDESNSDVTDCMMKAISQVLKLGAILVLFSITLNMVTAFFNTVTIGHIILIGILEITNGIDVISKYYNTGAVAATLMATCTSFGSISCLIQAYAVCKETDLRIFPYGITKIIQAIICFLIMCFYIT